MLEPDNVGLKVQAHSTSTSHIPQIKLFMLIDANKVIYFESAVYNILQEFH